MTDRQDHNGGPARVLALSGGIGGAKLALGLDRVLAPGALAVLVNTGDDFRHLGLHVSPDIDTVLYTLSGLSDRERGWGRADESWVFMEALEALGGETWFQLGDRDLATHVERTRRLAAGDPLSAITADFAASWGVSARILPMSDDPVRTVLDTADGTLAFQDFFVRRRAEPQIRAIRYEGADTAAPLPAAVSLIADPGLDAIVLCPSNPYLSVDPMLAMPGLRAALTAAPAPVIAVSPIVGGRAVKGPTAKIMAELGRDVSVATIAEHYAGLIDVLVIDEADAGAAATLPCEARVAPTVMESLADREALARTCLDIAADHAPRKVAQAGAGGTS